MGYTTFPYQFPAAFDLDGSNPSFPFTFPTVFGLVKARLDVTVTATAAMGEAPQINFNTAVTATSSASASVATSSGSNDTVVSAGITADALKNAWAQSNTSVTAEFTAEALETGRGEGSLSATATPTAGASAQYPFAAEFSASTTASAEVTRDASAESTLSAFAVPTIFAVNSTTSSAELGATVGQDADSLRDAVAQSSLSISAESSCEALETGRGEGFLSVYATVTAECSAGYPASSELAVEAATSSSAHRTANADSVLDARAWTSKTFPFNFPFVLGEQLTEALRDAGAEAYLQAQVFIYQIISQNIVGALHVIAEGTGTGYLYAPVDSDNTSVTAAVSAQGTNLSRAQSNTDVSVNIASALYKDAGVEYGLAIQIGTEASLRNDAVANSALEVTHSSSAVGVENDAADFQAEFFATPTAVADRDAAAASSGAVTADTSADSLRVAVASDVPLTVSATPSAVAAVPTLISTLTDYFNSKDETKWVFGAGASVSGGRLILGVDSYVESRYSASAGQPWWKFTDSCSVTAQLAQVPNGSARTQFVIAEVGCGNGNIKVVYQGGDWKFSQNGGVETVVPFSEAGSWFRLRRTSSTITWDTSIDGINWTERKTDNIDGSYVGCSVSMSSSSQTEISPGEAHWDNFNILPISADATLSVSHSSSGICLADKYGEAYFTIEADTDQGASNNANASSGLAVYFYSDQYLMKTLNASANLDVLGEADGRGTEYNPADAELLVDLIGSAALSRGQNLDSDLGIVVDDDAALRRGMSIESPFLTINFEPSGAGSNNASAHAYMGAYAYTDAESVRIQYLAAELAATVQSIASAVENSYADGSLSVAAQLTAQMSRGQGMSAVFEATATAHATAVRVFNFGVNLAVTALGSGQVEEPREVIKVDADNRNAVVVKESRRVTAKADIRIAAVQTGPSRSASVKADVRLASAGTDSSRSVSVVEDYRFAFVPAETLKATI